MKRILLPLLILVIASALTTLPVVATSDEDNWNIAVFASNSGTVASFDARYCMMPETMPIRPGTLASLQDARGRELEVSAFQDIVAESIGSGDFHPGDPCQVYAYFLSVVPQEGLRLVITPDPESQTSASPERVTITPYVESFAYDWWYNEQGAKDCRFLGNVPLGEGALLVSHPPARLTRGTDMRRHQLQSGVSFSVRDGAERCGLTIKLEFPLVDEYVIQFGGEMPDGE